MASLAQEDPLSRLATIGCPSLVVHGELDPIPVAFGRFLAYVPVQRLAETGSRGIWKTCVADVAVAIEASPAEPVVGAKVTYRVTVTNHGPLAAPGVVLELRPPAAEVSVTMTGRPVCAAASRTTSASALPGVMPPGRR